MLLFGLSAADRAGWFGDAGSDRDRYHGVEATVTYAADGDTIDVDIPDGKRSLTRVRLWGVDCPETAHGPDDVDAYFGPEAKAYVGEHVVGRRVRLALDPNRRPRDRYHRLLAYAYLVDGGAMLNEELVLRGLAYADRRFDHVFRHRFGEIEKRAMREKAGLWKQVTARQMPEWRQRMDAGRRP